MKSKFSIVRTAAVAAVFAGAVSAQAVYLGSANADYLGGLSGHFFSGAVTINWGVASGLGSGTITAGGAGFLSWRDLGTTPAPGPHFDLNGLGGGVDDTIPGVSYNGTFNTICSELQFLTDPQGVHVWDAPYNPSNLAMQTAVNRGAGVVWNDFDGAGGTYTTFAHALAGDNNRAAGFQLAVWAAIYGGGAASFAGLGANGFSFSGFNATAIGFATSYYNSAASNGFALIGGNPLWLESVQPVTGQNQFTLDIEVPPQSVPEPFTMALGAAGAAAYIRRRIKGQAVARAA